MKKIILSIIIIVFAISCGSKPEKEVTEFLSAIKEKKLNKATKSLYDSNNKVLEIKYDTKIQKLLYENLFKNMEYEVFSVNKIDKDNYSISVNITNLDTKKIFTKVYTNMMKDMFSSNKISNVEEELEKILNSNSIDKITINTVFDVVKTNKGYKIKVSEENVDAMFGGLYTTMMNLDNLEYDDSEGDRQTNSNSEQKSNFGKTQKLEENKK